MSKIVKHCSLGLVFLGIVLSFNLTSQSPVQASESKLQKMKEMDTRKLASAIKMMNPHLTMEKALDISRIVKTQSTKFSIDSKIMMAIINVESNFKQNAVSSTGDFSLSQINYKIWNKELARHKRKSLDLKKLKTDHSYAIERMAEILKIIQDNNKKDPLWYAQYHSKTKDLKMLYAKKVNLSLSQINKNMTASAK